MHELITVDLLCKKDKPSLTPPIINKNTLYGYLKASSGTPLEGTYLYVSFGTLPTFILSTNAFGYYKLSLDPEEGELWENLDQLVVEYRDNSGFFEDVSVKFEPGAIEPEAIEPSPSDKCELLYPSTEGNKKDKLNVAFVVLDGGQYQKDAIRYKVMNELIDPESLGLGFGSAEPFKSLMHTGINFYYYVDYGDLKIEYKEETGEFSLNPGDQERLRSLCGVDKIIVILKRYHSKAVPADGIAYVSLDQWEELSKVVLHEFGHLLGLWDEYVSPAKGDRHGYPNCAPNKDQAKSWWGSLVGEGSGDFLVGYYSGCSYIDDNIRPTLKSIMNDPLGMRSKGWLSAFGKVNEVYLEAVLKDPTLLQPLGPPQTLHT